MSWKSEQRAGIEMRKEGKVIPCSVKDSYHAIRQKWKTRELKYEGVEK